MYEKHFPSKRYRKTLAFLEAHISKDKHILDLGIPNPLSDRMTAHGYQVQNTSGEDLDIDQKSLTQSHAQVVTAFEIFEHLLAPFNVLRAIEATTLVATIPLDLWFAKAYRSKTDMWDRHYHEFEDWQFDWLLEKSGWKIQEKEKWTSPIKKIGFRPILRNFTPRYYAVYATR
mgnify:CR=1 FL=1